MSPVTITLGTIGAIVSLFCWWSFLSGAFRMLNTIRLGQKDGFNRWLPFFPRLFTMIKEFLAHTRMIRIRSVGIFHWMVMIGFLLGAIVWFEAYIQTFNPHGGWPWLSNLTVYHFVDELLGLGTVVGILVLIGIRQKNNPNRGTGLSRFVGSDMRAAYFVEAVVLLEGLGMVFVKAGKLSLQEAEGHHFHWTTDFVTGPLSQILPANELMVSIFALIKLLSGMVWLYIVGRNITWGVAWHRFSAFFNIYTKRDPKGGTALGAVKPMTMNGEALTMEKVEEMSEEEDAPEPQLGVGAIEDFSWKGWLDFTTCTECGRCQSQCPAWNTAKPLSPKLLIMSLRDHGYAKAPYLLAGGKQEMGEEVGLVDSEGNPDEAKLGAIPEAARIEAQRPLVGETVEGDVAASGIIDPEALWACTNCGACVEQCPVDIEHVDHIVDMRRYQVLLESEFPSELAGLFKNLENKGNPWGQNQNARLDWTKPLDFDVPVIGQDVEDLGDTEYLFWVGCAGAYEDRAKKTTQAVATLLHTAGVSYAVLGQGETCTGDSARRAGNEFLFQMLAQQNIETINDAFDGVAEPDRKVVVTCPHCLNALKNEYGPFGGKYKVVHHTQLLNRLVREKRLVPVSPMGQDVTYHDPCFLGRHNQVYEPPRELIDGAGAKLREMPRHGQRSMCCGAGGARMWMEETIGKRINIDRVDEALSTDPQKIATGCPFCRVMLTDGTTSQTDGTEKEGQVEVVDVSQMLVESITTSDGGLPDPHAVEWLDSRGPGVPTKAELEAAEDEKKKAEEAKAAQADAKKAEKQPKTEDKAESEDKAAAGGGLALGGKAAAPGGSKAPAPGGAKKEESAKADSSDSDASASEPKGAPKSGGLSLGGKAAAPGGSKAPAPGGAKKETPADASETGDSESKVDSAQTEKADGAEGTPAAETQKSGAPKAGGGLALGGKAKAPGASSAPAPGGAKAAEPAKDEAPAEAEPEAKDEATTEQDATESAPADDAPKAEAPASTGGAPKAGSGGLSLGGKSAGARKSSGIKIGGAAVGAGAAGAAAASAAGSTDSEKSDDAEVAEVDTKEAESAVADEPATEAPAEEAKVDEAPAEDSSSDEASADDSAEEVSESAPAEEPSTEKKPSGNKAKKAGGYGLSLG